MEAQTVVLLMSGPICGGKSTLAKFLVGEHGFQSIRSGAYLRTLAAKAGIEVSRHALQGLGDNLDDRTDYAWLIEDVAMPLISGAMMQKRWLLDSVRKERQVEHFRTRFGEDVLHLHFTAPEPVLRARYEARLAAGGEYEGGTPYDVAISHQNEVAARALGDIADLVLDTTEPLTPERLIAEVARHGLHRR